MPQTGGQWFLAFVGSDLPTHVWFYDKKRQKQTLWKKTCVFGGSGGNGEEGERGGGRSVKSCILNV